ncbi:MAG: glycerophosphodiester phosphodiesterase family protein [bacterium]|nr:glycerophosphodiester phosphodiesterase family protein [bacterium]
MNSINVIAHRGASAYAPENTFPAFELAYKMESDAIETDVRCTRDNILVLIHDETVDRTTNGTGKVSELTIEEINNLDAGSWFSSEFAGIRIPTLGEFLVYFGDKLHLVLEIKERRAFAGTLNMVRVLNLLNNVTFTSFDIEIIKRIRQIEPKARVGLLTKEVDETLLRVLKTFRIEQVCPKAEFISLDIVNLIKKFRIDIRAWGVEDEDAMVRLLELGIYSMTVNFPDKLRELLSGYKMKSLSKKV